MIKGQPGRCESESQQGWLPAIGLALALTSCYGTLALVAILGTFGIALRISNMVWGAVITVASATSWLALARNASRHGRISSAFWGYVQSPGR